MEVKGDNIILAKANTTEESDFNITFPIKYEKTFDFFCYAPGIDTILFGSITRFENDTPDMTFFLPMTVERDRIGKIICPKCGRSDKVYEIEYGYSTYTTYITKKGDTITSPIFNGKYQVGTCVHGIATCYCDRDKLKF